MRNDRAFDLFWFIAIAFCLLDCVLGASAYAGLLEVRVTLMMMTILNAITAACLTIACWFLDR